MLFIWYQFIGLNMVRFEITNIQSISRMYFYNKTVENIIYNTIYMAANLKPNTFRREIFKHAEGDNLLDKKKVLQTHWWKVITNWVNVPDSSHPLVREPTLQLPIANVLDKSLLDSWTLILNGSGYKTTFEGDMFTISQ